MAFGHFPDRVLARVPQNEPELRILGALNSGVGCKPVLGYGSPVWVVGQLRGAFKRVFWRYLGFCPNRLDPGINFDFDYLTEP